MNVYDVFYVRKTPSKVYLAKEKLVCKEGGKGDCRRRSAKEKSSITKIKNRKPGKKLTHPPTQHNLITSHFKPIASNSDVSDETESYVQRQEGEGKSVLCILSRSLVTRPPS